jgi:hypothetical protein
MVDFSIPEAKPRSTQDPKRIGLGIEKLILTQ